MDAADLRVFEAVARCGGMSRAAAELHTVQSNVTARIQLLETELGAPLFFRHRRGVGLTPAGRRLLPYAAKISVLLQDARRAVAEDGTPKGPLLIGSLETAAALRLSRILAGFAAAYPDVDMSLSTGTSASLIEDVLEHRVDGAFVAGPVRHPELTAEPMFREELVLLTARNVRGWDDLLLRRDLKLVVFRAGCSYRQVLEAMLAERGVVGVRRVEFGTLDGILGCVAADIGVTMLPRAVLAPEWEPRIAMHRLPRDQGRADTVFVRRSDAFASAAMEAFVAYVRPPRLGAVALGAVALGAVALGAVAAAE